MRHKEEFEPTALNDLIVSEYENKDVGTPQYKQALWLSWLHVIFRQPVSEEYVS